MRRYIAFIFLLTLPIISLAQVAGLNLTESDIVVEMVPDSPGSYQKVFVRLNSYITDINSANITWTLNGQVRATGLGTKNFDFNTGSLDSVSDLSIKILTREGFLINKNIKIKPLDVDLVWEADSYVPPFYKGKSLFSHENQIKFIAIPHIINTNGQEISPKNLIYKWIKDDVVMDSQSGYGKNTITITGSLISRPIEMSVLVTSPTTSSSGVARIKVEPVEPTLLFYSKNPVYGIEFQRALQGIVKLEGKKEMTVVGIPYYFGVRNTSSYDLTYKWSINGAKINGESTNTQTFVQKEGASGKALISISVESASKILQYAKNSFNLEFSDTKSETINNSLF